MSVSENIDIPYLSAARYNALVDRLEAFLNGNYTGGRGKTDYPHPWKLGARYHPEKKRWQVRVRAGLVNAGEVEGPPLVAEDAPAFTLERLPGARTVRPWLSEEPWFTLEPDQFRRIGEDAEPAETPEAIKGYFADLGVTEAAQVIISETGGAQIAFRPTVNPETRRLLRAVEIILSIPKPVARPEIIEEDGVQKIETVIVPPAASRTIRFTSRWSPAEDSVSISDQLATGAIDPVAIERRIGTFYLLSPPGVPLNSEPDSSWTPIAEQGLFWQLFFAWRAEVFDFPDLNIGFPFPLAGGVGQGLIDSLVDDLNRTNAAAAAALNRSVVYVMDWTL